jgi:hypothetical protein
VRLIAFGSGQCLFFRHFCEGKHTLFFNDFVVQICVSVFFFISLLLRNSWINIVHFVNVSLSLDKTDHLSVVDDARTHNLIVQACTLLPPRPMPTTPYHHHHHNYDLYWKLIILFIDFLLKAFENKGKEKKYDK